MKHFFNALGRVGGYCAACKRGACAVAQVHFWCSGRRRRRNHRATNIAIIVNHLNEDLVAVMTSSHDNSGTRCWFTCGLAQVIWCIGSLKVFGGHQHCCRYILPTALVAVIVMTLARTYKRCLSKKLVTVVARKGGGPYVRQTSLPVPHAGILLGCNRRLLFRTDLQL